MRALAHVLFDESHRAAWSIRPETAAAMNPGQPADASYAQAARAAERAGFQMRAHTEGEISAATLADVDVLVLPHGAEDAWESTTGIGTPNLTHAELDAIEQFVRDGGGLLLTSETEIAKYGNSHAVIAARFGIHIANATVQDPVHNLREVATWVLGQPVRHPKHDLLAGAPNACLYRAGYLQTATGSSDQPFTFLAASSAANPPQAALAMGVQAGRGRVLVIADSDLFGDDSINDLDHEQLWLNVLTWLATPSDGATAPSDPHPLLQTAGWQQLVAACEGLREMQTQDGSIDLAKHERGRAEQLARQLSAGINELAPQFPHQADHLAATVKDVDKWIASDFGVPDFYDSLMLFHPDEQRQHELLHLVVFPMYTQNGNRNRNFEAVITRVFWPDWVAQLERDYYGNNGFLALEFVGFTQGYHTHSAVLFPETVATRQVGVFTWGAIFQDREAARFRHISQSAADLLKLALPPDAELLLAEQQLAHETFVLWDLIHDRTHSHGDLPFDPFMIKQRMPYWMYALEELRCDLNTFVETFELDDRGVQLGRFIRYAILFDRLFRFPITGDRNRNYDGLGGQIMFAWLHRNGVLRWTDNTLSLDWPRVGPSITELCTAVNDLYRTGIDRSRIAHWLASHEFVASLVEAHPGSAWSKGVEALPINGELRELVDSVLPDEFPLNVFYEALRTKLTPAVEAVRGITA